MSFSAFECSEGRAIGLCLSGPMPSSGVSEDKLNYEFALTMLRHPSRTRIRTNRGLKLTLSSYSFKKAACPALLMNTDVAAIFSRSDISALDGRHGKCNYDQTGSPLATAPLQ